MDRKNILMGTHEYKCSNPRYFEKILYSGGLGEAVSNISEGLPDVGLYSVIAFPRTRFNGMGEVYPQEIVYYKPRDFTEVVGIPAKSFRAGSERNLWYHVYPTDDGYRALDHSFAVVDYVLKEKEFGKMNYEKPRVDIVHCHDWLTVEIGIELKKKLGTPFIFSVHMSKERPDEKDNRLIFERWGCEEADIIHAVSFWQRDSITSAYNIPKNKVVVLHNGVNTDLYRPRRDYEVEEFQKVLKKYGLKDGEYILSLGRITRVKNLPNVVEAFKLLSSDYPELQLAIFGMPGDDSWRLQKAYDHLPENVKPKVKTFEVVLTDDEKLRLYQGCAVAVFPSSIEAFGIVAIEAMACGKPVVVGDVGGFKENVVDGVTGRRVNGEDPKSILEGIYDSLTYREKWGKNAREWVEKYFSWKSLLPEYHRQLYSRF
jgi:glycosyltransferase involved in cell wall biosynthesis